MCIPTVKHNVLSTNSDKDTAASNILKIKTFKLIYCSFYLFHKGLDKLSFCWLKSMQMQNKVDYISSFT